MKKNQIINTELLLVWIIVIFVVLISINFLYYSLTTKNILNSSFFEFGVDFLFHDFINPCKWAHNQPYFGDNPDLPFQMFLSFIFGFLINSNNLIIKNLGIALFWLIPLIVISMFCIFKKTNKTRFILLVLVLLLSNIFLFEFKTANFVLYSFLFTCLYLYFYNDPVLHNKKLFRELSYIFISLAISLKFYPAIFAIFVIRNKDIKGFIKIIIYTIVIFFACLAILPGDYLNNLKLLLKGFINFSSYPHHTRDDLSLSSFVSILIYFVTNESFKVIYSTQSFKIVLFVLRIIFSLIIVISSFVLKKKWKICLCCSLLACLMTSPAFTYSGIFLFIPIGQIIMNDEYKKNKFNLRLSILLLIIIIPCSYGKLVGEKEIIRHGLSYPIRNYVLIAQVCLLIILSLLVYESIKIIKNKKVDIFSIES